MSCTLLTALLLAGKSHLCLAGTLPHLALSVGSEVNLFLTLRLFCEQASLFDDDADSGPRANFFA